jgi:hypothetical protein
MSYQRILHVLFVLVLISARVVCAGESTAITASTLTPAVNEPFTVTVTMASNAGVSCWGQVLTWDSSKLRLDQQQAVSSPFGSVVPDSRTTAAIQSSSQVRTGGYYEAAGPTYPDHAAASGAITVFTFTRIAAGTTTLSCPVKSGGDPFGLVLITSDGTERSPAGSTLTVGDPAVVVAPPSTTTDSASSSSKHCGFGSGLAVLTLTGLLALASLRLRSV